MILCCLGPEGVGRCFVSESSFESVLCLCCAHRISVDVVCALPGFDLATFIPQRVVVRYLVVQGLSSTIVNIIDYCVVSPTTVPICSMYGRFTYIYHGNQPNVGKHTIHGSLGVGKTALQLSLCYETSRAG